jgi:excisionase family DNA binding protein
MNTEQNKNKKYGEPLLDEPTAAALLAVSYNHLRMWLRPQGKISFIRVGKNGIRYALADIQKYIEANRVEPTN